MKMVQLDWENSSRVRVTWCQGAQPLKHRIFDDRPAAEAFAAKKMGKTGYIISTLDMTPEQRAAEEERRARFRAALA